MRYLAVLLSGVVFVAASLPGLAGEAAAQNREAEKFLRAAAKEAGEPVVRCNSVAKPNAAGQVQKVEICVKLPLFTHHIYTLSVNGTKLFKKIDDEVVTFTASSNGKSVTGGCKPDNRMHEGTLTEMGRSCTVIVDGLNFGRMEFVWD